MPNGFHISAEAKDGKAQIRIIGRISKWWNDSDEFRYKVDELIADGVEDVELYIKSEGGDVFEAAEIVNIMRQFKGTISGVGGSIVASAGTYIAIHCDTFHMAQNGQWMYHKPHGSITGNEDEIKARLELLKNLTTDYVKAYAKKTGKSEEDFRELMKTDQWITAQTASDDGFIDGIVGEETITSEDLTLIEACGSPIKAIIKSNNKKDMEVSPLLIGLKADASKQEIEARLVKLNAAVLENETLKANALAKEQEERTGERDDLINAAVKDKKIQESQRATFVALAESNFDSFKAVLAGMQPVQAISATINPSASSPAPTGDKDYAWYLENDMEALANIEKDTPEVFEALVNAHYK